MYNVKTDRGDEGVFSKYVKIFNSDLKTAANRDYWNETSEAPTVY